jgi:hypothetical protein
LAHIWVIGSTLRSPDQSRERERERRYSRPIALDILTRAKERLDTLDLYERPVSVDCVRVISPGWLFRLPWFRRFDGYTMWNLILLRAPELEADDDLVCHELCHVWQMQHRPVRMPLSYLRFGYAGNPYEEEARRAVTVTRPAARRPDLA